MEKAPGFYKDYQNLDSHINIWFFFSFKDYFTSSLLTWKTEENTFTYRFDLIFPQIFIPLSPFQAFIETLIDCLTYIQLLACIKSTRAHSHSLKPTEFNIKYITIVHIICCVFVFFFCYLKFSQAYLTYTKYPSHLLCIPPFLRHIQLTSTKTNRNDNNRNETKCIKILAQCSCFFEQTNRKWCM